MTAAAVVVVIAALRYGREVLIPVALSMLLSFTLAPLVSRLQRLRIPRAPAVLIAVATTMIAMATMGWLLLRQASDVAERLPEYRTVLHAKLEDLRDTFSGGLGKTAVLVKELGEDLQPDAPAPPAGVVRLEVAEQPWNPTAWIQRALWPAVGALALFGMVALFVTFMLLQQESVRDGFLWIVGDHELHLMTRMLEEASHKVSQYLLSQLLINGFQGLMVGIGLTLIGVPDAVFWGVLSAFLRFVPYLGPWVAALGPILVSVAVMDGWTRPLITVGLFLGLELVSNNVIEPYMYAAKTGLSSLAIVVSGLFWTWLWGGFGLVLSTPLTVCLVVMGKYVPQLRAFSVLLGDKPALSVAARLYQRVLSNDFDGAWNIVADELKGASLLEVYDSMIMPALSQAASDCRRREVEEAKRDQIQAGMSRLVKESATFKKSAAEREQRTESATRSQEQPMRVLCLPTTDSLDETAAMMLCNVLIEEGMDCEVLSAEHFAGEVLDLLAARDVDVVCVSHIPPPSLPPIRYLCKRLLQEYVDLPVIVGAWTMGASSGEFDLGLPNEGQFHVAGTLARAQAHARQLHQQVRVKRMDKSLSPTRRQVPEVDSGSLDVNVPPARA